jgi:light-regulated signal transduction histidine kinase (bacteriophytochrome)
MTCSSCNASGNSPSPSRNCRICTSILSHYADDLCVLEGEPAGLDSRMDAASLVRKMIARLNVQTSLAAFHQDAARQVRALTGFDRAMIYRFQPNGAGEVIAEALKPGMESLLGLHYPASDIPVQARSLYLRSFRHLRLKLG